MKNFYLTLTLSLLFPLMPQLSYGAEDQYHVSTEPQTRHVLLEEFTGTNCGNCPDGHRVARELLTAQPELMHVVSIHAGYYSPAVPNYKVQGGVEIDTYFTPGGYPSGMINRQRFGSTNPVIYRSEWYAASRETATMPAPVNLWMEASYNKDTKKMTVDVEGYFTETVEDGAYLTVMLTQDGIMGPQAGATMEYEYEHMHMLRAMLTPTWGDEIADASEGAYFSRRYTYDMPEVIGSAYTDPTRMEFLAFVTKDREDVLNVTATLPECEGMESPLVIKSEEYKIPMGTSYGFNFIDLYVTNQSLQEAANLTFEITFNGKKTLVRSEDVLAPRSKTHIQLPVNWMEDAAENDNVFSVKCVSANGSDVKDAGFSGRFGSMKYCSPSLKFQIKTDNYASDNTFLLKDADGQVVKVFGPYPDNKVETYTEQLTLDPNKTYCFEIEDAWADGIYTPRGNFKIYDVSTGSDVLVAQNLEIKTHGCRVFFNTNAEAGIEDIEISPVEGPVTVWTADGRIAGTFEKDNISSSSLPKGIYFITSPGNPKAEKILIK